MDKYVFLSNIISLHFFFFFSLCFVGYEQKYSDNQQCFMKNLLPIKEVLLATYIGIMVLIRYVGNYI